MKINVGKRYDSITVHTVLGDVTIGDAIVLDEVSPHGGEEGGYVLAVSPVMVSAKDVLTAVGERDYL